MAESITERFLTERKLKFSVYLQGQLVIFGTALLQASASHEAWDVPGSPKDHLEPTNHQEQKQEPRSTNQILNFSLLKIVWLPRKDLGHSPLGMYFTLVGIMFKTCPNIWINKCYPPKDFSGKTLQVFICSFAFKVHMMLMALFDLIPLCSWNSVPRGRRDS